MKLIRTTILSGASTAISLVAGLISVKVMARILGPAGIAYSGQLGNFISIVSLISSGAFTTGLVKYAAEYKGDYKKLHYLLGSSTRIVFILSILTGIVCVVFSGYFSKEIFKTYNYSSVFIITGICLFFIVFSTNATSTFNGLGEIKILTISKILMSISGVGITIFMALSFGVFGVLIAPCAIAVFSFFLSLYFYKKIGINLRDSFTLYRKKAIIPLLGFTLMAAVTGFLGPIAQLIIRNIIIKKGGLNEAGQWQAVVRFSDYYLSLFTTVLSIYYLPKISSLETDLEIKQELRTGYKIFLPLMIVGCLMIWFLRIFIIKTLLTDSFLPSSKYFAFQLIGDIFRVASWLISYTMIAKAKIKSYIWVETSFVISSIILHYLFVSVYGTVGATYAFALNSAVYLTFMLVYLRRYII